jgi:endonuclease VIII-like 1
MPELAEVRLMSEFFNDVSQNKKFKSIRKSKESKVKTDLSLISKGPTGFSASAQSRGKETLITISGETEMILKVTYGMSGYWANVPDSTKIPMHSHLIFEAVDGSLVCLVDVRRFAKWSWVEGWSKNRGPDPTTEFELFTQNITNNIHKKVFNKPICEILMDQKYFNGIGNYLRAEILHRADVSPWMPANVALYKFGKILELCKTIPLESYVIGGGSIKDWKNPYGNQKISMNRWLKCYGKLESAVDQTGRRIWFDKKHIISV